MQTSRTFRLAAGLLILGLVSEGAGACAGVYTDFSIDTEESELTAWGAVADSYNDGGYCFGLASSQWGYWEHTYEASVDIESPTMNTASDSNTLLSIPYGGGETSASATISFDGDPGQFIIIWTLRIYCTVGGWFIDYFFEDFPTIALVDISRYQNPTNSSDKADLELSEAISILFEADSLLWSDEDAGAADDVSCRLLLVPWPPTIGTFGPFGNGDGIIDDEAEVDEVFAYSWLVSVVKDIDYCKGTSPLTIRGCGLVDQGIIVTRGSLEGILWAHEYGHHKGLWSPHNTSPDSLGYGSLQSSMTRVTQTECDDLRGL